MFNQKTENMCIPIRAVWPFCVCLCVAGLSGCGGGYDTVSLDGEFRINGQPVEEGGITFSPLDGDRGRGVYTEVKNGHYQVDDVPVGRIHVTFIAIEYTGRDVTIMGVTSPESKIIVPPKYRAGIDIEIGPNDTTQDFDLSEE